MSMLTKNNLVDCLLYTCQSVQRWSGSYRSSFDHMFYGVERAEMPFEEVNVKQAVEMIDHKQAQVVDVRDPISFENGHIEGSVLISDNTLQQYLDAADFELPLIVCCYHGNISKNAAEYFSSLGFKQTFSLAGGYEAWAHHQAQSD
jgi:thiosulfate sulfurtransferase